MALLMETVNATNYRKLVKSQVEKRRRERINCSLEHLRTMLLQETQQTVLVQRKVEKADILEHTVLFLQTTTGNGKSREGRQYSFQDGFSACLQRAAHFLGPQGKELEATLDAATRFAHPDSGGPKVRSKSQRFSPNTRPHNKFYKRTPRLKDTHISKHRLSGPPLSTGRCALFQSVPVQHEFPGVVQQSQRLNDQGTETHFQNLPVSQSLWRPWP